MKSILNSIEMITKMFCFAIPNFMFAESHTLSEPIPLLLHP